MTHPLNEASASEPATQADSFIAFFQPFYNLSSNRLQGFEALARRHGSDGTPLLPQRFFAAAEASGKMRDLDVLILDQAIETLARWREIPSAQDLILSVNLSWQSVGHSATFSDILTSLARHQVPGDRLLIDITTGSFRRVVASGDDGLAWLRRLQEREISFCLDGFTADDLDLLPQAASAPVDIIKLHPAQVVASTGSTQRLAEVASSIQEVGMPVVAAGVETREHLELVRELGFEWAQGFLLGEPVAAEQALLGPDTLAGI